MVVVVMMMMVVVVVVMMVVVMVVALFEKILAMGMRLLNMFLDILYAAEGQPETINQQSFINVLD